MLDALKKMILNRYLLATMRHAVTAAGAVTIALGNKLIELGLKPEDVNPFIKELGELIAVSGPIATGGALILFSLGSAYLDQWLKKRLEQPK